MPVRLPHSNSFDVLLWQAATARRRLRALCKSRFCHNADQTLNAGAGVDAVTAAEQEANAKRWEESGGGEGSVDEWRWRLEWNAMPAHNIVIGSCPRSPADMASRHAGFRNA